MLKRIMFVLSIALFVSSCANVGLETREGAATKNLSIISTSTHTKSLIIITESAKPSSTSDISTVNLATSSATLAIPTNTVTPRPSLTPTWTFLPTMLPKQAEQMVEKLISANSLCRLPCIGGVVPGETSYAEAKALFSQVAEYVQCDYLVCGMSYHRSDQYPFLDKGPNLRLYRSAALKDELSAIITGWYRYSVTDLLTDYGQPEEIYLSLHRNEPFEPRNKFDLLLYYPSYGFITVYSGTMGTGKQMQICPVKSVQPDDTISFLVWNPTVKTTFKEIATKYKFISPVFITKFRPLGDYGEITVDEFYEQFNNPKDRLPCFEVDSLWYQER